MIDAEDYGQVGTVGRSRDNHTLRTCLQMRGGHFAGGEDARAFHGNFNMELAMG